MKTIIYFVMGVLTLIQTANSQEWISFGVFENKEPSSEIIESSDSVVEFRVSIPGMYVTEIDTFHRVEIPGHYRLDMAGFPELPLVSYILAIPECDSVSISVTVLDSAGFDGILIYPAPELVKDTTDEGMEYLAEQFSYNDSVYAENAWFTDTIATLSEKGAVRRQKVVRVVIYPLKFNPVEKSIIAYSEINITLTFINHSGSIDNNAGIFSEMLGNTLVNYESNGLSASVNCGAGIENPGTWCWIDTLPNQKIDSPCDYLIITHQNFYNNSTARQAIDSLAAHRANFNGFDVAIITLFTIYRDIPKENRFAICSCLN